MEKIKILAGLVIAAMFIFRDTIKELLTGIGVFLVVSGIIFGIYKIIELDISR